MESKKDEVVLGDLLSAINTSFNKILIVLYRIISFYKRYWIVLIALIVIGFGYEYYKSRNSRTIYTNQINVIPNFGSVDYLYDKIIGLNSKIKNRDTLSLSKVFKDNYGRVVSIDIEPIIDAYGFLSKSRENIDIFRIISSSQDITEYYEDETNIKHHKFHRINIKVVDNIDADKIVNDFISYLNENNHFNEYKKLNIENLNLQISQNDIMVAQIDSILSSNNKSNSGNLGNQSLSVNSDLTLSNVINVKRALLREKLALQISERDGDQIIKQVDVNYNITSKSFFSKFKKFKYPFILILLFSLAFLTRYFYNKIKILAEEN